MHVLSTINSADAKSQQQKKRKKDTVIVWISINHFNPHSILQKYNKYYALVSKFCIVDRQSDALDVHCVCVT